MMMAYDIRNTRYSPCALEGWRQPFRHFAWGPRGEGLQGIPNSYEWGRVTKVL